MQKANTVKAGSDSAVEEMFKVGAHYGYSKTRRHPTVAKFIYATKNKGDIIDLEKTNALLEGAAKFAETLGAEGKVILFVGTKPEAKTSVKAAAEMIGMPYVTERWIGGTISNFGEIKKRIADLENYEQDEARGELAKYTKKERVMMAKNMEKLSRYYRGLIGMKKTPDALFIVDAKSEHIAFTEAVKSDIPVIALVNSDSDIRGISYPIVANDGAIPSIKYFGNAIAEAYKKGSLSRPEKEAKKE